MNNKRQLIIGLVAMVILGVFIAIGFRTSEPKPAVTTDQSVGAPWPSQEIEKLTVSEETEHYSISAVYPMVVSESITNSLKNFIDGEISQFKDDTSWVNEIESASSGSLSLDISYQAVASKTVQNYIFSINSYTGGAHGMQVRKTFSYDKTGQLLGISSVFTNGLSGLETLSTLVKKELMKREEADFKWISDGASPKEDNYSSFVITDTGITILFDPYQVAAYSEGSIDVAIPVSAFAKIASPQVFRP